MKKLALFPYTPYATFDEDEMINRAENFKSFLSKRRTVREFSTESIPKEVIENCLLAAGTAPNGANKQPWHFAVVKDPIKKKEIREAAEKEEMQFYNGRANEEWLDDLAFLGTDHNKPFLEDAPYLIVIFSQTYGLDHYGEKKQHYYVRESVGIATGMLITALHNCGLSTLTHTPSPMGFLNDILDRPKNEKAFLVLVVGKAAPEAKVPDIQKKKLDEIASFF